MRKWLFIALLLFGCKAAKDNPPDGLVTKKAMVVSARIEASQIGADIMKKGGNAFDAMVATELALAVAYPYAGNIGGGGFMVYRKANGETGSLDYREKAPAAASKNMFLDASGNVIPGQSTDTALAIGIPGNNCRHFRSTFAVWLAADFRTYRTRDRTGRTGRCRHRKTAETTRHVSRGDHKSQRKHNASWKNISYRRCDKISGAC
jgi:hypothetical protein